MSSLNVKLSELQILSFCDFSYIASILYVKVNCMHIRRKNYVKLDPPLDITDEQWMFTLMIILSYLAMIWSFLSILIIGIPKKDFNQAYSDAFANYLFILYFVILTEKQTFYLS